MRLLKEQLAALEQFGSSIGEGFAGKHISPHDVAEVARRKTPALLRDLGITGNHEDRQLMKDEVQRAALGTAFPEQSVI